MKKIQLLFIFVLGVLTSQAQIVSISPATPSPDGTPVTITYDATQGNAALVGAEKVYIHTGVVIDSPDGTSWNYVVGNWGQDDGVGAMTRVPGATDRWEIALTPDIRQYYKVSAGEPIFRLSMVFRNADGSVVGRGTPGEFPGGFVASNQDIYIDLPVSNFIRFTTPTDRTVFLNEGETVTIAGEANKTAASLTLSANAGNGFEQLLQLEGAQTLSFNYPVAQSGEVTFRLEAVIDGETLVGERSFNFVIREPNKEAELPGYLHTGINYFADDPTKAGLVLIAPGKETVYVVGDFTNWEVSADYQMNRTPDGEKFWIELEGLEPGKEYAYQYWIDNLKIGDPYADKVADPWNDSFIPESVYPNLLPYNRQDYGVASVLQTNQQPYEWKFPEVVGGKPAKEDLMVYELLVRDFVGSHSYKDLTDTLSYLKRLGVNAIELMPIMEFEGNESWGYNPSYFFAPDKYYGTKNDLKRFIDKAHEEGFVVILDMVLNHAFGQNSMVRMYWDSSQNRPAANNPWFNQEATHPFNVGYDFNHESAYTQAFVDTVNLYWLKEYNFDGYRFDLSKGFTQRNNPNDVGAWSARDESRIALLKRMADKMWEYESDNYIILEHLSANDEEKELAEYGMLLWGNLHFDYADAVKGNENADIRWGLAANRGWNVNHAVTYMESHDEERLVFINKREGRAEGSYNIKNPIVALDRVKLGAAFFFTVPGPKMFWQFGELGYDFSINACPPDGQLIQESCRTANKPIPWGSEFNLNYHEDPERIKLYKTFSALINLRNQYKAIFKEGTFDWVSTGKMRRINLTHNDLHLVVVGNFGTSSGTIDPQFSKTGTWYSFFEGGTTFEISDVNAPLTLAPGEFKVFTDRTVNFPETGLLNVFKPIVTTDPETFRANQEVKITFDASAANPDGTNGLIDADNVFMVAGIVTDSPNGTELQSVIGENDATGAMQRVAGAENLWEIILTPNDYFNVSGETQIYRIGMYFRDESGANRGKGLGGTTIFVEVTPEGKIVTTSPETFIADDEITITFDAVLSDPSGTAGLIGSNKVYIHTGIVTQSATSESWTNVVGNWGQDDGVGEMTRVAGETDKWQITLTPRSYYNIPFGTRVYRLGMVFRNADGSAEGKAPGGNDIFVEVQEGEVTGLTEDPIFEGLRVYPNPANNVVTVQIPEGNASDWQFRFMSISGKVIYTTSAPPSSGVQLYQLDITTLPNGLYLLEVQHAQKRTMRKVLISH